MNTNENENESFLTESDDGGFVVDMTAVPEAKNEILPKAIYNCIITECEYKLSQSAGLPMWSMVLEIEDGDYKDRKLFNNMSFSDKALPYTKKTMAAICPELLTNDFKPHMVEEYGLTGRRVRAKTKIGKDQEGNNRTEVGQLMAAADNSAFMGG